MTAKARDNYRYLPDVTVCAFKTQGKLDCPYHASTVRLPELAAQRC